VYAHGGFASVRTAPGQGATFRVTLPLAPEAQGDAEDPGTEEPGTEEPATTVAEPRDVGA
jgi:two-component system OmpR family sensor kinase